MAKAVRSLKTKTVVGVAGLELLCDEFVAREMTDALVRLTELAVAAEPERPMATSTQRVIGLAERGVLLRPVGRGAGLGPPTPPPPVVRAGRSPDDPAPAKGGRFVSARAMRRRASARKSCPAARA